jgi:hypothetical protein
VCGAATPLTPDVPFRELSQLVGTSLGEAHNATKRLEISRLYLPHRHGVNKPALVEFLVSGVPYVYPGELGLETRGVPTAYSGPVFEESMVTAPVVVWPSVEGEARGLALTPLCAAAPLTISSNPPLYHWLTIIDALRVGRARDRRLARQALEREIGSPMRDAWLGPEICADR